jgi:signal transduction histidine kinase
MRLLAGTLVWIVATIAIAGWSLSTLFRQHVADQFRAGLDLHLEQLIANLTIDEAGTPSLSMPLSDPRLSRPYSGLYWQVDRLGGAQEAALRGVLRSRSLWDSALEVPLDTPADGEIHEHQVVSPNGAPLRMIERMVYAAEGPEQGWRLIVAADARLISEPVERFNGLLAWSLGVLGCGLIVAAIVQVRIGLRPLGHLRKALTAVQGGTAQRIEGGFPQEIQPLVDDFNAVLAHNTRIVAHARTQAGNLAHAVKTPLTILANAAARPDPQLPQLVTEQVAMARRQVDYHLARARAAAATTIPGVRSQVRPLVESLVRVMGRLYRDKPVSATLADGAADPAFRGDQQDLQEMLGNVLDNAWKWAAQRVEISTHADGGRLIILIDDDGPGLAPERRQAVLARGVRADEGVPGSGLGLAITRDLAQLYAGSIDLDASPLGGCGCASPCPPLPWGWFEGVRLGEPALADGQQSASFPHPPGRQLFGNGRLLQALIVTAIEGDHSPGHLAPGRAQGPFGQFALPLLAAGQAVEGLRGVDEVVALVVVVHGIQKRPGRGWIGEAMAGQGVFLGAAVVPPAGGHQGQPRGLYEALEVQVVDAGVGAEGVIGGAEAGYAFPHRGHHPPQPGVMARGEELRHVQFGLRDQQAVQAGEGELVVEQGHPPALELAGPEGLLPQERFVEVEAVAVEVGANALDPPAAGAGRPQRTELVELHPPGSGGPLFGDAKAIKADHGQFEEDQQVLLRGAQRLPLRQGLPPARHGVLEASLQG